MNRHKARYEEWLNTTEEEKYALWSNDVEKLGIGLDYVSWSQLHEAELQVAASVEEKLNAAEGIHEHREGVWI